MNTSPATAGTASLTLLGFTDTERKTPVIDWYRSPLPAGELKSLHRRSDALGWAQTLGYLGVWTATAALAILSAAHGRWWTMLLAVFAHGTVSAFMINAVHELGHGTVFRTRWLNAFFTHVLAFLGWINHETFQTSHARHHRYTLHPPDDLEVTLPIRVFALEMLKRGLVNPGQLPWMLANTWRIACGRFAGEWELALYPADDPTRRRAPICWARTLLIGHGFIVAVSLAAGWWIVPVVVSLTPLYGSWLHALCNGTQHVGLQDNVPDFRLCCRTFTLNPLVRFLYWHMNYHTEHHMYAAVPCYRLGRLHRLIRHDLPPCTDGLVAVWREIAQIVVRQEAEPGYRHEIELPSARTGGNAMIAGRTSPR